MATEKTTSATEARDGATQAVADQPQSQPAWTPAARAEMLRVVDAQLTALYDLNAMLAGVSAMADLLAPCNVDLIKDDMLQLLQRTRKEVAAIVEALEPLEVSHA